MWMMGDAMLVLMVDLGLGAGVNDRSEGSRLSNRWTATQVPKTRRWIFPGTIAIQGKWNSFDVIYIYIYLYYMFITYIYIYMYMYIYDRRDNAQSVATPWPPIAQDAWRAEFKTIGPVNPGGGPTLVESTGRLAAMVAMSIKHLGRYTL